MTEAKRHKRHWRHTGSTSIALGALFVGFASQGCDGPNPDNTGGGGAGAGDSTTTTTTANDGGGGGTGGTGGSGGGGSSMGLSINESCADIATPLDATPDPEAANIYFTAVDPVDGAGVYTCPFAGGPSKKLAGDPLTSPFGIAVATDGSEIYVADAASSSGPNDEDDAGQIFVVANDGGTPAPLSGTAGFKPISLEVFFDGESDQIYFSGRNATGAGIFTVSAKGGTVSPVVVGDPFHDPSGVVVAKNGDVYAIDTNTLGGGLSTVQLIKAGQTTAVEFAKDLHVGFPAGIALSLDETKLFLSGFDDPNLKSALIQIDIATGTKSLITSDGDTNIALFEEAAGLHRAKNKDAFAWADSKAKPGAQMSPGIAFGITF